MNEDDQHEWNYRVVYRERGRWLTSNITYETDSTCVRHHHSTTEAIIQRRRKRDHLDPTPCEGIEHPIWRDWEASPDPEIHAVLVRKGMPFRSLEK
jgi:hypothetical protein